MSGLYPAPSPLHRGAPVVVLHIPGGEDEGTGLPVTACNGVVFWQPVASSYPGVPRVACPACQRARPHELLLRADPVGWYCRCKRWEFGLRVMAHRRTGNNYREAELAYMSHRDAQPGAYGAGPGYN